MIKRFYLALPGPTPFRIAISAVIVVAFLIALNFFYEWLGNTFLDTGGTIE